MDSNLQHPEGLRTEEVEALRQQWGKNKFETGPARGFFTIVGEVVAEPMFLLLAVACALYFILGEITEGLMMATAIVIVSAISLYQEWRSNNAVRALRQYTAAGVLAIRNGEKKLIASEELVPGDLVLLEEGMLIPADAEILEANDLSVNESIITGESMPVDKSAENNSNTLFQGTTVNRGNALARIVATGSHTQLGKLGKTVGETESPRTLLQVQMRRVVRRLAIFGITGFLLILAFNYVQTNDWAASLLLALTLAMSAVPEEIPVALSSFMALGAYKMSRLGIISRQPQTIENLGAVSVICIDKTGTITENKMQVIELYDFANGNVRSTADKEALPLLEVAALASETRPFDPMEIAIWEAYEQCLGAQPDRPVIDHEYPLQGRPPMMTHLYQQDDQQWRVAAKGAAERLVEASGLSQDQKKEVTHQMDTMAAKGFRVLAIAKATHSGAFPEGQDAFDFQFLGLLALYDPPKAHVAEVLSGFYRAHIMVKLVTGDHPQTAMQIARQVGMQGADRYLTGDQLLEMSASDFENAVEQYSIFARMFPDAKKKLVDALQARGEIVAMTGDGVNDGPALKAADIGIAMGKRGTEIARRAADLVITDDQLGRLVTAVQEGRKIFSNLKKAIRYIVSIHIPIILVASLPLILGWAYPAIFTPIHVIFLELIMGPTCSIFFEREPAEANSMGQYPRKRSGGLFSTAEWWMSVVQGLVIAAGALLLYYYFMEAGTSLGETRNIVFTMLLMSNIFLTFSNRSATETIFKTWRYRNSLATVVLLISVGLILMLQLVAPVRDLFGLTPMSGQRFFICLAVSVASVWWMEVYKLGLKEVQSVNQEPG